jgi:hypothetical protein
LRLYIEKRELHIALLDTVRHSSTRKGGSSITAV